MRCRLTGQPGLDLFTGAGSFKGSRCFGMGSGLSSKRYGSVTFL